MRHDSNLAGAHFRIETKLIQAAARRGRKITTRWRSVCQVCGHDVPVGASAWYSKDSGAVHDECIGRALDDDGIEPYVPRTRTASEYSREFNQSYLDHLEGMIEDRELRSEFGDGAA